MGLRRSILEVGVFAMRTAYRFRKPKKPYSILVLRNNDLGDLVAVTPLFQALRTAFPDAQIVAAVGSWSTEILKNNPYISEVVACDAPWHNHQTGSKSLVRILKYIFTSPEVARLRTYNFDVGIDVVGSTFGSVLLIHLRIPIRVGRKGYAGGHTGSTIYLENTFTAPVTRGAIEIVQLLKDDAKVDFDLKPQLFLDAAEIEEAEQTWREIQGPGNDRKPRIVIAPGAGLVVKQWPAEMFAELVGSLAQDSCGCILGSPGDYPLGEVIARDVNGWSNRCGKVSIRQSMALVSLADLVVCPSTLMMHLASAFNKPCVVILTRALDQKVHRYFWELEGLHYQLYPAGDEEHVRVAAVEDLARQLLKTSRP